MNVLLILTDQQHADTLSCAGNPVIDTPCLDRLVGQGVRFDQHYTPCALCTPARASIMTGLYPRTHGAWHVGVTLDTRFDTMGDYFTREGYRCAIYGKSHLEGEKTGYADRLPADEVYYGFPEHGLAEDAAYGDWWTWICTEHPEYRDTALKTLHEVCQEPPLSDEPGTLHAAYPVDLPEELSHTHWITDRSIDFMEKCHGQGEPFLAVCSYVDPHHPWTPVGRWASKYKPEDMPCPPGMEVGPPEGFRSNYCFDDSLPPEELQRMLALYYGMISHIDFSVGRIMDWLNEQGLAEDTVVIFSSDHGDHIGNRRMIRKSGALTRDIMHVPMVVRTPACAAGKIVSTPSQHEDLLPTMLDLCGLDVPPSLQGESLANSVRTGDATSRRYLHMVHDTGRGQSWAVSDGHRKLTAFHNGRWKLTDLNEDPHEFAPYLEHCPEEAQDLYAELAAWLIRTPEYRAPKPARW